MNSKHRHVLWYGASEELQAKLMLATLTTPDSSDVAVTQQELPVPTEPASVSPKTEQLLLDPPPEEEIEKPKPSTPSEEDIKEAAMFSPSDLHQYNYTINCQSSIMIRYRKGPDPAKPLAASIVQQDTVSPDPIEAPPQKKQKVSSMKVWPKKDSGRTLLYHPPKPDDDGPPSMV